MSITDKKDDVSFDKSALGKQYAVKIVAALVVLAVLYYFRGLGLVHFVVYSTFNSPFFAILVGGGTIAGAIHWFTPKVDENPIDSIGQKAVSFAVIIAILFVLAASYGIVASMYEQRTYADQTMAGSDSIEEFPSVNEDNPRIAPKAVADVQTRGSVSYRQHRLGASDIARTEDGSLAWSYPIEPDGFRNKIYENQRGIMMSDMTTMEDRDMIVNEEEFTYGQGMFLHRGATWNLRETGFWSQYIDDPIEFVHDGDPYMAFPKTGHEWHMSPIPHTTTTWDGVALVHTDGTIEHLSPEEAQESEILDGQRLYPLHNNDKRMGSLGYREGIINQMPVIGAHQEQIEYATMPSDLDNSQPFVIDMQGERMSYVSAMEPYGFDTRGLDEVWFTDSRTGEMTYFETGSDTLLGPERAAGIVRSEDSRTNWVGDDGGSGFRVVEPVPTVVEDELWWHTKIVPSDNTDVSRNVFVNAHSGVAIEIHDTEAVVDFIGDADTEEAETIGTEPVDDDSDDDVVYYVVVYDEDGEEVDRIPVTDGDETTIEQSN